MNLSLFAFITYVLIGGVHAFILNSVKGKSGSKLSDPQLLAAVIIWPGVLLYNTCKTLYKKIKGSGTPPSSLPPVTPIK